VQMFKRQDVELAESTINGWFTASMQLLEPLYELLKDKVLQTDYLMADETPIPVQTKDKPEQHIKVITGFTTTLCRKQCCLITKKVAGVKGRMICWKNFSGYLQTDGYTSYNNLTNKAHITQLSCWAHVRRYFEQALENDQSRSEKALGWIRELYSIEREAREQNLQADQIRALRQSKSKLVLQELEQWLKSEITVVLPKSVIGTAIAYALKLWPRLTRYTEDGRLNIDNNLTENSIRPVALGRKNYLFAGSHDAAQRAAMIYSFLATCKINNVEPFSWLKDTLTKIADHPANRLEELLPGAINQ